MMKKIFYILTFFSIPFLSVSQQMPHYSLYMLNDIVINPSLISTKSDNQIGIMIRDQWTDLRCLKLNLFLIITLNMKNLVGE